MFVRQPPLDGGDPFHGLLEEGAVTLSTGDSRFVATVDDDVAGYVAVIHGVGWSSHVGELCLVVDPGHRGRGLGCQLAHHALRAALAAAPTKVVVEQRSTIRRRWVARDVAAVGVVRRFPPCPK